MIPVKLKICSRCGDPCRLWRSSPKLCRPCADNVDNEAKRAEHKPLIQTEDGKVAKVFKINHRSKKRAKQEREYEKVKAEYFKEHPVCEFPGCESTEISLHHSKGRCGALLTDKRYFKSLCLQHHREVEMSPEAAKEIGLSLSRLAI